MKRSILLISLAAVLLATVFITYLYDPHAGPSESVTATSLLPPIAPVGATLLDGLGDYSRSISTDSETAQRWFDQGLMLTWGFNHQAAERSFLKAIELDPECAMCWWGAALVLGPHVNAAMDPANNAAAWERLQAARSLAASAEPWEQAWIEALATRYAEHPDTDRSLLDQAYAEAMSKVTIAFPDDLDAAAFYAEALMDIQPWNYWDEDGDPIGNTSRIVAVLEGIIDRHPDHAGALHLYIHAVEASETPERGAAAADRLRTLIPGSGHLVHMPAHIYSRVGRWHDAVVANGLAIEADNAYLSACRPGPGIYPLGYVPHNHHFMLFAATMAGERKVALDAADATHARTDDPALMRTPGFEPLQNFALTPLFASIRFGLWDKVHAMPAPAGDLPYMVAMWEYGQGLADLRTGDVDAARAHHVKVAEYAKNPKIEAMTVWNRYSLIHGVRIAERTLAAELAWQDRDIGVAETAMRTAISIEDDLPYDEPPAWHYPGRMVLGAMLLEADRAADAETEYLAELRRNPDNGWSLLGLTLALQAQGRLEEAAEATARFDAAWSNADFDLKSTRL